MLVSFDRDENNKLLRVYIQKTDKDKRVWNESHLLYKIKNTLRTMLGMDLIKKRMWKDGHMYGSEETQYIRSRKVNTPESIMIYDGDYAIRDMSKQYNRHEQVTLLVEYCQ